MGGATRAQDEAEMMWEHLQHTSDDWEALKDQCPECYLESRKYKGGVEVGTPLRKGMLEDMITSPNPLEDYGLL